MPILFTKKILFDDIEEFIAAAMEEIIYSYFGNISNDQLADFEKYFSNYIEKSIVQGYIDGKSLIGNHRYLRYKTKLNMSTFNVKYALLASGLITKEPLSGVNFYVAKRLKINDATREQALKNLIDSTDIEQRVEEFSTLLSGNKFTKITSPSIDNLVDIFISVNNIKNYGGEISEKTRKQLKTIWTYCNESFPKQKNGNDNLAYEICYATYKGELHRQQIDLATAQALKHIANVNYNLTQIKRKNEGLLMPVSCESLRKLSGYLQASALHNNAFQEHIVNIDDYKKRFFDIVKENNDELTTKNNGQNILTKTLHRKRVDI